MDRTEFIFVTAVILFVAFALGWLASWVFHRVTRVTGADMAELDRLASMLHKTEEDRDEAITYLQQREAEMSNQLNQAEAELNAAMEGLREARQETEEMRTYIEEINAR